MYTNLILYRNELKNKSILKYKVIGIITELVYSKEIFKKNDDIKIFAEKILDVELKPYMMKSRSLIVSRLVREIIDLDGEMKYKNKLVDFINFQIEVLKKNENIKEKKNKFDGWLK